MSARSRALDALADHFECLRDETTEWLIPEEMTIYTAWDVWGRAADMARRAAVDERWRQRVARWIERRRR